MHFLTKKANIMFRIIFCGVIAFIVVLERANGFHFSRIRVTRNAARLLSPTLQLPRQSSLIMSSTDMSSIPTLDVEPDTLSNDLSLEQGNNAERFDRSCSLYIGNLAFTTTESDLSASISDRLGDLSSSLKNVVLVKNPKTGSSRGYGYANFQDQASMMAAKEKLNGLQFEDRVCRIDTSMEIANNPRRTKGTEGASGKENGDKTQTDQKVSLYVGNISYDASSNDLEEWCTEKIGSNVVRAVRMPVDKFEGRSL